MKAFTYTITDPMGLHARPAGLLVKTCQPYQSAVSIFVGDRKGNAKSMLSIMGMAVRTGTEVRIECEGADEEQAAAELEAFFKASL